MKRQKVVYICSPYSDKDEEVVKKNVEDAKKHSAFAVRNNVVPITPHLLFPQFMDESQRDVALSMDLELLQRVDELWVFGGKITKGMREEIDFALHNTGVIVRHFNKYYQEV